MTTNPYAAATAAIHELVTRKVRPLTTLEAVFVVTEAMSEEDAKSVLHRLIAQRYLCQLDADLAQFLAQRLGVQVQWSHARLTVGELDWKEGRGP